MGLRTSTIDNRERLEAVEALMGLCRRQASLGSPVHKARLATLKSLAGELQTRAEAQRAEGLAALQEQIERVKESPTPPNYDQGQLVRLATIVIQQWPLIRQAIETYREPER